MRHRFVCVVQKRANLECQTHALLKHNIPVRPTKVILVLVEYFLHRVHDLAVQLINVLLRDVLWAHLLQNHIDSDRIGFIGDIPWAHINHRQINLNRLKSYADGHAQDAFRKALDRKARHLVCDGSFSKPR